MAGSGVTPGGHGEGMGTASVHGAIVNGRLRGSNCNREENTMRKIFLCLLSVLSLGLASQASDAQAETYSCLRPDGASVCTINSGTTDPSVQCNRECLDCNLVCTAQLRVVMDGNQIMTAPSRPQPGRRPAPVPAGSVETPQYCRQQFADCSAACRSNPNNRSSYDQAACISSCESTRSGCGRKP